MDRQCIVCGSTFTIRTKWSKEKRATAKWCSQACYHASWTPQRRSQIALNAKKYIESETPEQRKARMSKVGASRIASGKWKPSIVGYKSIGIRQVYARNVAPNRSHLEIADTEQNGRISQVSILGKTEVIGRNYVFLAIEN